MKNEEVAVPLAEMGRLLTTSKDIVLRMANAGTIPALKVGRDWRLFPAVVIAELAKPRDPRAKWSHFRNARGRAI